MNIQRLISIGGVGFFMFLAVINGLMLNNATTADGNSPLPVRAPLPTQGQVKTTPAAPGRTAPVISQPLPQPVPVPPAVAATAVATTSLAPTQAASDPVSSIWPLLVITVIGSLIGLMVLRQSWQRENGRFSHAAILAPGAQS